MSLQPLPETRDALRSLDRFSGRDLFGALMDQSREVMSIVPSCVGLSVSMLQHGVTFTLVAAPTEVAVLDGIQYAVGGPPSRQWNGRRWWSSGTALTACSTKRDGRSSPEWVPRTVCSAPCRCQCTTTAEWSVA